MKFYKRHRDAVIYLELGLWVKEMSQTHMFETRKTTTELDGQNLCC